MNDIEALLETYNEETSFMSSCSDMTEVPSFKKLVALGEHVLPFAFKKMIDETDTYGGMHMFILLNTITKTCPPLQEHDRGKVDVICGKWLDWGKLHGYVE